MFIGHFGLGLLGKAATVRAPRTSLGTWFLAVQLSDLLWPLFLLLGWEHVRIAPGITRMTPLDFYDYPITHSLVGALGLSAVFAVVYALVTRRRGEPGAGVGMPVLMGLAVFSHWPLDLLVHRADLPLRAGGADPIGRYGAWLLLAALPAFWLAAVCGPPPPSESKLAWMGLSLWLFPLWAWWIDRHRLPAAPAA